MTTMKQMTVCGLAAVLCCSAAWSAESAVEPSRTIHLKMDDAQIHFSNRIYELKHVSSEDILPFVSSAVLRYNRNSTIRRVTAKTPGAKDAILVSTGEKMLPHVDNIVAALDHPPKQPAKNSSSIAGTGLTRIAYTPKYRAARELEDIINNTLSSSAGQAYVNEETNTVFWRDQSDAAGKTLSYIERLDRPLPQVNIRMNYYELRDSDLKDWGFDYLAWKNGPGVNLLNIGYNAGSFAINQELLNQLLQTASFAASNSWAYGGMFTAPQIDMSFIRCLQQSGNASATANATLTMVNTPVRSKAEHTTLIKAQLKDLEKAPYIYKVTMEPEYQNISKNTLGRTVIGKSFYEDDEGEKHGDPPVLEVRVINPFVCLPTPKDKSGSVIFDYSLFFKNVVERGNTGSELSNSAAFSGAASLSFGIEKVLYVYEKENDIEQTVGIPVVCRIPIIKYLVSTVTSIKERTYIVVTAEAQPLSPDALKAVPKPVSASKNIKRRIENPFQRNKDQE